jgi:hypothetical protein
VEGAVMRGTWRILFACFMLLSVIAVLCYSP